MILWPKTSALPENNTTYSQKYPVGVMHDAQNKRARILDEQLSYTQKCLGHGLKGCLEIY